MVPTKQELLKIKKEIVNYWYLQHLQEYQAQPLLEDLIYMEESKITSKYWDEIEENYWMVIKREVFNKCLIVKYYSE
jgi:hypothetical protein